MTIIAHLPRRAKHLCNVCLTVGFEFRRWSSIALDETCPDEVPHACSDDCAAEMKRRIETGEWKLPVLELRGYHFEVMRRREGY